MMWAVPDHPDMHAHQNLESELKRRTRFQTLLHVASCNSTQELAAEEPTTNPERSGDAVFWADHQTRGRGRQDRIWDDNPGQDLAVTLRVTADLPNPLALPAALPIAVLMACEPLAGRPLRVKWPNDVYAEARKLSGVLIDRDTKRPNTYRIGVGINVNRTHFEGDLSSIGTSLALLSGQSHDRGALLLSLAESVDAMITAIVADNLSGYEQLFRERLGLLGLAVEVQARTTMHGRLTAIDFEELVLDGHVKVPLAIVQVLRRSSE